MSYNLESLTRLKHLKQLAQNVSTLSDKVDVLVTAGGEPNTLETIKVNGTALGITDKAVDIGASIAAAVSAADHLKRRKVASKADIDLTAPDAGQYIYMVPKTGGRNGDKYDEYMILDGALEPVGNWKVDLSDYVQKEEGKGLSANDYTDGEAARLAGIADAMYQECTYTQYRTEIIPAAAGTGLITDETVGNLLGDDKLAGLTSAGTDETGENQYDFIINGVKTGTYTKNTRLSDIIDDVNSSGEAGVSVSYSDTENAFIFTAKRGGAGVDIKFDGGLAGALFDPVDANAQAGRIFAEAYNLTWLQEGESARFTFAVPGSGQREMSITKDTTIDDVVDSLNKSIMGMDNTFSCNKYTGQIETKNKKSGEGAELNITDQWGDAVKFDKSKAPPSPYTYGKNAVFTAIRVNGEVKPVAGRMVDITVPTRVSQLTNDGGYLTAGDIATDAELEEMLAGKQNTITAGTGLTKDGDTLSVDNPVRGVLTLNEWDALTDEQKTSGTWFVDDGATCAGEDIYSTEEQVVGRWIDGKSLYRKVLIGALNGAQNNWNTMSAFDAAFEPKFFNAYQTLSNGSVSTVPLVEFTSDIKTSLYISMTADTATHAILYRFQGNVLIGRGLLVFLYYTKTTDQTTMEQPTEGVSM